MVITCGNIGHGHKWVNRVGVTIKYRLNQAPTTTIIPTINMGSGLRPCLNSRMMTGRMIPVKIANQKTGANDPENISFKYPASDSFILKKGVKNSFTLKYR